MHLYEDTVRLEEACKRVILKRGSRWVTAFDGSAGSRVGGFKSRRVRWVARFKSRRVEESARSMGCQVQELAR